MKKKIVFLTGTRADFGKLKPLIEILKSNDSFDVHIFATGMHLNEKYGYTVHEIEKCGYANIFMYINHDTESLMDITLSRTIAGFSNYVRSVHPDLIIVHGDRIEALAGASVGALNNILIAHIEGGELSGTVDELIRHAVSKLSHTHFVANEEAKNRLIQMGELEESIFVIGSPDIDIMLSKNLPGLSETKERYNIHFDDYAIALFHPVTTEIDWMPDYTEQYFEALDESGHNYIIIYPNNDRGSEIIMAHIKKEAAKSKYAIFPSIRFENFITLLKNTSFIVGNSSAGIREAPLYGIPVVNIGTRQDGRDFNPDIIHTGYQKKEILKGIRKAIGQSLIPKQLFGEGNSNVKFLEVLQGHIFWKTPKQKKFNDRVTVV